MEFNENQKIVQPDKEKRVFLKTGLELYEYFLAQRETFEDQRVLNKDLERTRPYCQEYKIDRCSGGNHLYNVLFAYAQYDLEIGYC